MARMGGCQYAALQGMKEALKTKGPGVFCLLFSSSGRRPCQKGVWIRMADLESYPCNCYVCVNGKKTGRFGINYY